MKNIKTSSITNERTNVKTSELVDGSYVLSIGKANQGRYQFHFAGDKQPALWYESSNAKFKLYLEGYFYLDSVDTFDPQINLDHFLLSLNTRSISSVQGMIAGGLFNLFIHNIRTGTIEILNDRMGLLPLYVHESEDQFAFSNNQFNFRHRSKLSSTACFEFLKYGYLPVSPSLFTHVDRMGAGTRLFHVPQSTTIHHFPVLGFKSSSSGNISESQWLEAFDQYFNRLKKSRVMMGLSGGYDSRWIAANIKELKPQLLNFGAADCPETKLAKVSADHMGLNVDNREFPVDGVIQYASKLRSEFRTISSLENIHVLHLSECVKDKEAEFYLDGFLGDVIVGDTYYREKPDRLRSLVNYLSGKQQLDIPAKSMEEYSSTLCHQDKQGLDDAEIIPYLGQHTADKLSKRYLAWTHENKQEFSNHYDQVEYFKLFTRGRNLIMNGPISIQQHTQVLTPFMDYRVLDLGIHTSKDLKFSGKLYNMLWRKKFPELSKIRKAGTFGKAVDNAFVYRLKYIAFVLIKRIKRSIPRRTQNQQEEQYFSINDYLTNKRTKQLIAELIENGNAQLPEKLQQKFRTAYAKGEISNTLLLRYVSLLIYLGD